MNQKIHFLSMLTAACCILATVNLRAQAYPVSLIAQSSPPHTGNLAELSFPGRVGASLILNDAFELSYQVRMSIVIEGQGIRLSTKPEFQPRPITLSYGLPVQITGAEIAEYLDLNNLNFEGFSKEQYLQEGTLPPGFYSVCMQVYDYDRSNDAAVSRESCTGITVFLNDPPVVLAPIGQQTPVFPQNVTVQWQPRHAGGFPVEYTLQVFEFDVNNTLTPDLLMQFEQPFLEKTINNLGTSFITPADPLLELGRRYLIRVRARDLTMQNAFLNDGWSAPEFFTYGEACTAPDNITAEALNESSARVSWQPKPGFNTYVVRYREAGTTDANWYEDESILSEHTIEGLVDATTYEIQVQTLCNGEYEGQYSPSFEITTDSIEFDTTLFDCSSMDTLIPPANAIGIEALAYGDIVRVGGFRMRLTKVEPSEETEGGWDGSGQIRVPWLLGKKLICTFNGLMVNTEKEVFGGEVVAYSKGLESIPEFQSPDSILAQIAADTPPSMMDFCGRVDSTQLVAEPDSAQTPPLDSLQTPPQDSTQTETPEEADEEEEDTDTVLADPFADLEDEEGLPYDIALNAGGSTLPIILGGSPNAIVIDNITFTPLGASLDAYFSAALPGSNKFVAFQSLGVKFHPGGLIGANKMQLVTDITTVWSNKIQLTILNSENSYVSFDCEGLRGISIDGKVEFCPNLLVALHPDSLIAVPEENVTGTFTATMPQWGQFVADMSITPFEIPRLKDWGWEVQNMVFDFSDEVTPASVVFPEGYSHPDVGAVSMEGADNPEWTGFYLRTARVKLPKAFYGSRGEPVQAGVTDVIIDQTGFTGNAFAINVLSPERGRMGNWAFSLDTLRLGIRHNQFHHVGFSGTTQVPAFDNALKYACLIQPDSAYRFSVGIGEDTMRMSAWKADIELYENTRIELDYDVSDRAFSANAYLFGMASMKPTIGRAANPKDTLKLASLQFQDFVVSTRAPYLIDIGTWEYSAGNEQKLSGFPLTIQNISLGQEEDEEEEEGAEEIEEEEIAEEAPSDSTRVALKITAAVNLMGANDRGFSAEGTVRVLFDVKLDTVRMKQVWSYAGVKVDQFSLDASGAAFELAGRLDYYEEDTIYGSGFRAMIHATFTPRFTVTAVAQFGEKNTYRYWFADALATFNPGIALGTTGLGLYGFGGGASYKVSRQAFSSIVLPDSASLANPTDMEEVIGRSMSGTIYVPDSTAGLGIKAIIALGTFPKPEVFNGTVTFEVIFNDNWGVRSIGFIGDGRFLTPPPTPSQAASQPALRCILNMNYDFENRAFHADLDVYVNHMSIVTGAYANNLAGRGTIHTDPDDWYIHIGTPQRRIMISYSLAGLANLAKPNPGAASNPQDTSGLVIDWSKAGLLLTAYLDAGTVLPPFPDIPERVQSILGGGDFQIVSRDDPRFASGGGVMFGASVDVSIPDLTFLMFYASFGAGMGFDVMVRNYGLDARCAGDETSSSPIGINGWYATGQLWAYIEGSIGIKVRMFSVSGNYRILDLALAAVLQTRLPNPLWAKGVVGGRFSILSGLVSGSCRFQFEIGKKCDIVGGSELAGIEVIASTQPDGNTSQDVDVFARPQATFNLPIGRVFELQDDNGDYQEYRPKLHKFEVLQLRETDNGQDVPVQGQIRWNETNDVVAFKADDVLTGNKNYRLVVQVRFDKKGRYESEWRELKKLSGTPEQQEAIVNFTTGPAPDYIPASNVAYSYPLPDQFNFLQSESTQGYIQLIQGQPYLFKGHPDWDYAAEASSWEQKVQFMNGTQVISTGNITYNSGQKRVNYAIPSGQLPANAILAMRLANLPLVNDAAVDANVTAIQSQLLNLQTSPSDTSFTNIILEERIAQGVQRALKPKSFYKSNFRTSLYNTFQQKINALTKNVNWFNPIFLDPNETSGATINDFGVFVTGNELFDLFDQDGYYNGDSQVAPLIQPEADLNITPGNWYTNTIYPYMYQHFPAPAQNITLSWRNPLILGNVPSKAIWIEQTEDPHKLTQENIDNGTAPIPQPVTSLAYKLPYHMLFDDFDYKNKVSNYAALHTTMPQAWVNFMQGTFQYAPYGNYRVQLKYHLPGNSTANSQIPVTIFYGVSN